MGDNLSQPGNRNNGVQISNGAQRNVIGGTNAGTRNIISHNGINGVTVLDSGTRDNMIIGNYIGTDVNGTAPLGNATEGVIIQRGAQFNAIGGSGPGEGNVISANAMRGIGLWDTDVMSNTVAATILASMPAGHELGNNGLGVVISNGASYNRVGGTLPGERNVISGNSDSGVGLWDSSTMSNTITGNYIGLAVNGLTALGNYGNGVLLASQVQRNRVGGASAGERNVIGGNRGHGIYVGEKGTRDNVIVGNYVGLDITGSTAVPNLCSGVTLDRGTQQQPDRWYHRR